MSMTDQQYDDLMASLSRLMDQTEDFHLFDKMDDAKRELEAWNRKDELHCADLLREWGLLPEENIDQPSPVAPNESQLEQILAEITERIIESEDEEQRTELKHLRKAILSDRSAYLNLSLPNADMLTKLGLWPYEIADSAKEAKDLSIK